MTTFENYKGYVLHIFPEKINPEGTKHQTVVAYKDGQPVKASFAELALEDPIEKIKLKIDKIN